MKQFVKQFSGEIPSAPATPLLGIHPKELKTGTGHMFTAALFAMPSCPSKDEEIDKLCYTHAVEY